MDDFCTWLNKIVRWIDVNPLPPMPFVGPGGGECRNAAAPHLELTLVTHGAFKDVRIGDLCVTIPANHVSLHSVHFGNYGSARKNTQSWCMFFDVSGVPEFEILQKRPIACQMQVSNVDRLAAAYETVTACSRMHRLATPHYVDGPWAYRPESQESAGSAMVVHLKAAVLEVLAILKDEAEGVGRSSNEADSRPVRDAMAFMAVSYMNPDLRLKEVAAAACLSVDHFGRVFRRHMGVSPLRYLRRVRVDQGCFLLSRTLLRVSEVAARVGFKDPLHFSRVFRRKTGMSPREYRSKHHPER